jgi:hypothetical protein
MAINPDSSYDFFCPLSILHALGTSMILHDANLYQVANFDLAPKFALQAFHFYVVPINL